MTMLIWGLVLFLGAHSVRIVAEGWRAQRLAQWGEQGWKKRYTLVSLAGFALMVVGFGHAREATVMLWQPPAWGRHAAMGLMLLSMVLLAAAQIKPNHFSSRLRHPMLVGVLCFSVGHLMANGRLHDVVLFGALGAWALVDLFSCLARDRRLAAVYPAPQRAKTVQAVVGGLLVYGALVAGLHKMLMGVSPLLGH
jgi:uncharacterized membrane protein